MASAPAPPIRPPFLSDAELRLLLFAGKGGVGKTTCAAAAAIYLAQAAPTVPFLIVSVDPAHSLRDAFAADPPPPNLELCELDAPACLASFRDRHRQTLREIARRGTFFDEEDVQRFVELSLPGMDELLAFLRIAEWTASGRYRTVIVDTAPSGHAQRLLEVPDLLLGWVLALDTLLAKHRYLATHYRGSYEPDATDQLLAELTAAAQQTQKLLRDPQSCLVPVLTAEPLSLRETTSFIAQLTAAQLRIGPLLVNRLRPPSSCPQCQQLHHQQLAALHQHAPLFAGRAAWGLPLRPTEVRGVPSLAALWTWAEPLPVAALAADRPPPPELPPLFTQVRQPLPLPAPSQRLLLFAGKGGVGKSTLASATALRLAATQRPTLLLSTDPAHSIADCLALPVGPLPVAITPFLAACAPDAKQEWRSWRQEYDHEVESLWTKRWAQAELVFDRQALDRLLDLSPPGIDELVSLSRVSELLDAAAPPTIVIDTAPTGHLLRLLELPALLTDWLKAIFAMLLKNRQLVLLPKLTDRLIALSKRLKKLRALLADPQRASLYAVTIPTWLADAETADLLAACQRLRVRVAGVLLNQVSPRPPLACPLCTAIGDREAEVAQATTAAVAPLPVAAVGLQSPPVGVVALAALGGWLYQEQSPL